MTALYQTLPEFVLEPIGTGTYASDLGILFFCCRVINWRMRFLKFKLSPWHSQSYTRKESPLAVGTDSMCPPTKVQSLSTLPGMTPGKSHAITPWSGSCMPKRNPKALMRKCDIFARAPLTRSYHAYFDRSRLGAAIYSLVLFMVTLGW